MHSNPLRGGEIKNAINFDYKNRNSNLRLTFNEVDLSLFSFDLDKKRVVLIEYICIITNL